MASDQKPGHEDTEATSKDDLTEVISNAETQIADKVSKQQLGSSNEELKVFILDDIAQERDSSSVETQIDDKVSKQQLESSNEELKSFILDDIAQERDSSSVETQIDDKVSKQQLESSNEELKSFILDAIAQEREQKKGYVEELEEVLNLEDKAKQESDQIKGKVEEMTDKILKLEDKAEERDKTKREVKELAEKLLQLEDKVVEERDRKKVEVLELKDKFLKLEEKVMQLQDKNDQDARKLDAKVGTLFSAIGRLQQQVQKLSFKLSLCEEHVHQLWEEVRWMKTEDLPLINSAIDGLKTTINKLAVHVRTFMEEREEREEREDVERQEPNQDAEYDQQEFRLTPMDALRSTKGAFMRFTQNTTIHGLSSIFNADFSGKRRLRHAVGFIFALVWFGIISSLAWNRYITYPVTSSIEVIYPEYLEYPAITICNANPVKKSYYEAHVQNGSMYPGYEEKGKHLTAFLLQQFHLGNMEVNFTLNENTTEEDVKASMSSEQWKRLVEENQKAHDHFEFVDEFHHIMAGGHQILEIVEHAWQRENAGYQDLALSQMKHTPEIHTIESDSCRDGAICLRLCHTINFGKSIQKTYEALSLLLVLDLDFKHHEYIVNTSAGYHVLIHPEGEWPDEGAAWHTVRPGFNRLIVERKDVKNLPPPYGKSDCKLDGQLKYYSRYSRIGCWAECLSEIQMRVCGCKTWPQLPGTQEHCNRTIKQVCHPEFSCSHCLPSCHTQTWTTKYTHKKNYFNELYITLEPSYTLISQSPAYPGTSLVGEVGGTLGLCIGASLQTLMEVVDLFSLLVTGLGITAVVSIKNLAEARWYKRRQEKTRMD